MDIRNIPTLFGLPEASELTELNAGHINRTFLADCGGERYILQSLNSSVFRSPEAVMENIGRAEAAIGQPQCRFTAVPHFIACGDKNYAAAVGELWRIYRYVPAAAGAAADAAAAGRAFGEFIRLMDGRELSPVPAIEGYHDFEAYYSELKALGGATADIMQTTDRLREDMERVFGSVLKNRIIHGDAKADNIVMSDPPTIIDLDTVMYGCAAIDYGDLVRSVWDGNADLSAVRQVTAGFAEGLGGILTDDEVSSLYYGILRSTGELAVRYLADSLRENRYFRGRSRAQCLARAEELLAQLSRFRRHESGLKELIQQEFRRGSCIKHIYML